MRRGFPGYFLLRSFCFHLLKQQTKKQQQIFGEIKNIPQNTTKKLANNNKKTTHRFETCIFLVSVSL